MVRQSSQFITQLRTHLSEADDLTLARHVLIFAGDEQWHIDVLSEILPDHEDRSLLVGGSDVDILERQLSELIPVTTVKKAHHWLGGEKQVVIFNASKDFDVDAFAAISGIVIGGGVFILLLASEEKWNQDYSSYFDQHLLESINSHKELILIKQGDESLSFVPNQSQNNSSAKCTLPFLTLDQQSAVESIEKQILNKSGNPVVLISDRGRGKSASLGIVAAKLFQSGIKNIAITAPRLRATDIVFKHIAETLPDAVSTRGKVSYADSVIQFYSPDQLINENIKADLLLVDEAAAIPVPLLTSFLKKYPKCVFATTVHGYEGTGRGFAIRFYKVLNENKPNWLKLNMKTPIRWPIDDVLEKWMFSLLCLDAEITDIKFLSGIDLTNIEHRLLTKEQLVTNGKLLNEVFALLVLAHYRTRPSDLKSLLDDDEISLYVSFYNGHVIAVSLVIHEGQFSTSLSTSVYRGERRPHGHLLAQTLTYHCGIEDAATLNYARVMRIAVHPELQQQGIGSSLLDFIVNSERNDGRDAIGTSFGMNEELLSFWEKLKFNVVRIGFTREQTSGEHAAIMLLPLNEKGVKINKEAMSRFNVQAPYLFNDVLNDIPANIKQLFKHTKKEQNVFSQADNDEVQSFCLYSRNYELCIAAINKLVFVKQNEINKEIFPDNFRTVINKKVSNKIDWKGIAWDMNLSGKSEARKLFQQAIESLLD